MRKSWSVSTWPRGLTCKPGLVEREAVGVGPRPIDTSTTSASIVSAAPPFAGSTVSVTVSPLRVGAGDLGAEPELEALLPENLVGFLAHVVVEAGQDLVEELDDGDLRRPSAATPSQAPARSRRRRSRPCAWAPPASSSAPVESTIRCWSISIPGSGVTDEPVAMTMFFARTVRSPTLTVSALSKLAWPLSHSILFFLNRNSMPCVRPLTASSRAAVHRAEVELDLAGADAPFGERPVMRFLEQLGRVEQRLGRDAADVEAGAAQRLAALGAGGLEAELRGTDRGDIAAGAGADHQDVEIVILSHSILPSSCESGDPASLPGQYR